MSWRDRAVPDSTPRKSWRDRAVPERGLVDAVAEPPPNPNYEVPGMSRPFTGATPSYVPPDTTGTETNPLLTNAPTNLAGNLMRGSLAAGGFQAGATAGIPLAAAAAPVLGPFAAVVPVATGALGAFGVEMARQNAVQMKEAIGGQDVTPASEAVSRAGIEAGSQAVGGGAAMGVGAVASAARPLVNKLGAQMIRVGSGVPEKYGMAAMRNPSSLLNAPSMEAAQGAYQTFEKTTGLRGLGDAVKGMGRFPSEGELENVLFKAAKRAAEGASDPQELYIASQAASSLKQMAKMGNPRYATLQSAIDQAKSTVDDALTKFYPEYGNLRQGYFDAKMAEQFSSVLPLNQNTSPNVLRGVTAATAAGAGVMAGSPAAVAALPLISPRFYGTALKTAAVAGKIPAGVYKMGSGAGSGALAEAYAQRRFATP